MAKNIKINNVTYNSVSAVSVPLASGGGNAIFPDTSDADAGAGDIASGKTAYVNGAKITGTSTGGGGGTPTPVSPKDVNFYDYDGTCVAAYTLAEAQALSALPTAPDHSSDEIPLTFQGWNYTLAQVNSTNSKLDVVATYIPTDGKTHLYITLTTASGKAPALYLNKSDSSTLTVDWGDGNTSTFTNSGNFNTGAHTYSAVGDYDIKMWISSGSGTYGLGGASNSTVTVGASNIGYKQTLLKAHIGSNVTTIRNYAFSECSSLTTATIPNNITSIGNNAFADCRSLVTAAIPNSVASLGVSSFRSCFSLSLISIPSGTSVSEMLCHSCFGLLSVVIPSVTSVGDYAFINCYSLKEAIMHNSTPPVLGGTNSFSGIPSICKIKVPSASLSAYKAATNWSTFANYMEGY